VNCAKRPVESQTRCYATGGGCTLRSAHFRCTPKCEPPRKAEGLPGGFRLPRFPLAPGSSGEAWGGLLGEAWEGGPEAREFRDPPCPGDPFRGPPLRKTQKLLILYTLPTWGLLDFSWEYYTPLWGLSERKPQRGLFSLKGARTGLGASITNFQGFWARWMIHLNRPRQDPWEALLRLFYQSYPPIWGPGGASLLPPPREGARRAP